MLEILNILSDRTTIILIILIAVGLLTIYHTMFTVYYFSSLGVQLATEFIIALMISTIIAVLGLRFWPVLSVVMIIAGILCARSQVNPWFVIMGVFLAVIFAFLGIYMNKSVTVSAGKPIEETEVDSEQCSVVSSSDAEETAHDKEQVVDDKDVDVQTVGTSEIEQNEEIEEDVDEHIEDTDFEVESIESESSTQGDNSVENSDTVHEEIIEDNIYNDVKDKMPEQDGQFEHELNKDISGKYSYEPAESISVQAVIKKESRGYVANFRYKEVTDNAILTYDSDNVLLSGDMNKFTGKNYKTEVIILFYDEYSFEVQDLSSTDYFSGFYHRDDGKNDK